MSSNNDTADQGGMGYLDTRGRKFVTIYLPLAIFLFVLLFPFYWMVITSVKPDQELLSRDGNPFWVVAPTLAHFKKLLFDTSYPEWMWNTVLISAVATAFSLFASVLALFQNLFGLAAGPFIVGMLSDSLGLANAMTVIPVFGALAAFFFLFASRSYEGDKQRVATVAVAAAPGGVDMGVPKVA